MGVDDGKGNGVMGTGEGGDSVKAGWQARVRKEARVVIHKRRMISFISVSFSLIIRVKSKCIEDVINKCCFETAFLLQSQNSPNG